MRDNLNGGLSGYSIVVNSTEARVRRRFTIAHEIAHFLCHRFEIGDGVQDDVYYRSGLSDAMEAQANRIAADIIMPRDLIRRLIDSEMEDVGMLANQLQVSEQALKIRLGIPVV